MQMNVAIIGTGNIGCDLMVKIMRSPYLTCTLMAGRDLDSYGSRFAKQQGIPVSDMSVTAIQQNPDICDIVFDATSAKAHLENEVVLRDLNKFIINLTPADIGFLCVPVINLEEALNTTGVNMITCGGQAAIPIANAISKVHPESSYFETISTIASKSAGIGTRDNIDEFTQITKEALSVFTGVKRSKSIIILNPAEPPINMMTTIYALIDNPNMEAIRKNVRVMVEKLRAYIPGYKLIMEPVFENGRVTTIIEITGRGDYLPSYAGNLDVITCAAVKIAEAYAQKYGVVK